MSSLERLARYQRLVLDLVTDEGTDHYSHQFHPDLSPSGWHLGHCVFTENYWIREVIEAQPLAAANRDLYVPEFSYKPARGQQLPDFHDLIDWAGREQRENSRRLQQLQHNPRRHPLLRGGYLHDFLIQHYAQHYETLCYARAQRQLQQASAVPVRPLPVRRPNARDAVTLAGGDYAVGQTAPGRPYDNEHSRHTITLAGCRLAHRPLSNAEFFGFMEDGGYERRELWSDAGWHWLQTAAVARPGYWRCDDPGHYFQVSPAGAERLRPGAPVVGINYHEAAAVAAWAGARLPHEHEWEAATRSGLLQGRGQVWEWCANAFYPYPGFQAYPYDGYSLPYFDNAHFVLRGGSRYTRRVIKRPSFRNYYEADKRHLFAGVRLAWDSPPA
ncbi:iron(II)-dependent oxidoreductase [Methylohalomonas lacus]|uniref:Iron(II)-dependent oxidoreductase n=1 Tax=Methylohalomonas lacus TaxID=398773 RepID=A0AAE3HJM8_9GAMM|nr:SUMF1/EgtB/PvdO family nonheme iron enzyme [Methylohalomonas lacus]MCS3902975.1 iron(II)-dependent oxidoreductase [Methylohalomonas lacus]